VYSSSQKKSHEQCVQSVKKDQSVPGMVKRHFKLIDNDNFTALYKTYTGPYWSTEYTGAAATSEDGHWMPWTKPTSGYEIGKRVKEEHVWGTTEGPGNLSLQQCRHREDLIETYKIMTGKEHVDSQLFSRWLQKYTTSMKVYVPRCAKTIRKTFFSVRVCNSWNSLPQRVIDWLIDWAGFNVSTDTV